MDGEKELRESMLLAWLDDDGTLTWHMMLNKLLKSDHLRLINYGSSGLDLSQCLCIDWRALVKWEDWFVFAIVMMLTKKVQIIKIRFSLREKYELGY